MQKIEFNRRKKLKIPMRKFKDLEDIQETIIMFTINNNLYRMDNKFLEFQIPDKYLPDDFPLEKTPCGHSYVSGYVFLDDDGGTTGMLRLNYGAYNPKWGFEMKDGKLDIDWA